MMNLPYGGSKGAVQVVPRKLSKAELERLSRAYIQAFARTIGPDRDIPAPDVYTNAMIMGWMADEYAQIVGQAEPAVITGKHLVDIRKQYVRCAGELHGHIAISDEHTS